MILILSFHNHQSMQTTVKQTKQKHKEQQNKTQSWTINKTNTIITCLTQLYIYIYIRRIVTTQIKTSHDKTYSNTHHTQYKYIFM